MPVGGGAAQCARSFGVATIVVTLPTRLSSTLFGEGIVTDVHGQLAQIDEQPHGASSGHPSSLSPLSVATSPSALATPPVTVASMATIRRIWSRRGTRLL